MRLLKKILNGSLRLLKVFTPSYRKDKKMLMPAVEVKVKPPFNVDDLAPSVKDKLPTSYRTNDVYIHRLQNAWVTADGVAFQNWEVFIPSLVWPRFIDEFSQIYLLRKLVSGKRPKNRKDKTLLLAFDHWSTCNYYHWIVDALPRLLVAESLYSDAAVLLPDAKQGSFVGETLKAFSFKSFQTIDQDSITKAENLVIPGHVAQSGLQHPALMREIRKRILSLYSIPASTEKKRKVYASRARLRRKVSNESELLPLLNAFQYETLFFEDLSFREQVLLMADTQVLMTPHGASLTNLLFLPPDATVVELGNDMEPNPCYQLLANCLDLKYYYVPGHRLGPQEHDDIELSINGLRQLLEEVESNKEIAVRVKNQ